MKQINKLSSVIGLALAIYAIFSSFYGAKSVAINRFKSSSVLLLANTFLLISIITKDNIK